MSAHCTYCKTPVVREGIGQWFICPNCGLEQSLRSGETIGVPVSGGSGEVVNLSLGRIVIPAMPQEAMHVFTTGAKRSELKPRYDLIPPGPLKRLADRYEKGLPYGEDNWKKGLPWEDTFNHVIAHLQHLLDCQKAGKLSNDDDLAAAAWGLFTLMWYEDNTAFHPVQPTNPKTKG